MALLDEGKGVREVARMVGVAAGSVTRWQQARRRKGRQALQAKPHPGRPRKLSLRDRRRLVKLLLQGPRAHGYTTELWTLRRVGQVIEKHFGVHYHPGHVCACWGAWIGAARSPSNGPASATNGPFSGGARSSGRA